MFFYGSVEENGNRKQNIFVQMLTHGILVFVVISSLGGSKGWTAILLEGASTPYFAEMVSPINMNNSLWMLQPSRCMMISAD